MKYDVERYYTTALTLEYKTLYAITDANRPIGLTLPDACESVEMGREFLEWRESHPVKEAWETMDVICVKRRFAEFLKKREEVIRCSNCDNEIHDLKHSTDYCYGCTTIFGTSKQPAEPVASEEAGYHITSYSPLGNNLNPKKYKIEHIESLNLVPKTFPSRADAEGFLKWWGSSRNIYMFSYELHLCGFIYLESEFARYKAETAEIEYRRCPECGDDNVTKGIYAETNYRYLECVSCLARCGWFNSKEKPHESWIHRKEPA